MATGWMVSLVERRARRVSVRWNDIEPVDQAGIDLRIEALPEMGREGLDHVGGAGAAMGHVDEGELHAALVFAMLVHARLETTQIYTQVSIRQLKQIHSASHPAHFPKPKPMLPPTMQPRPNCSPL